MEWENITVKGNQYIKVKSLKVSIPLLTDNDCIKFKTKNRELIHLAVNPTISHSWNWEEWHTHLTAVLLADENIPITAKCLFEHWQTSTTKYEVAEFVECSISERETYKFRQAEKQYEMMNGNTKFAVKNYKELRANSNLLKPYITNFPIFS